MERLSALLDCVSIVKDRSIDSFHGGTCVSLILFGCLPLSVRLLLGIVSRTLIRNLLAGLMKSSSNPIWPVAANMSPVFGGRKNNRTYQSSPKKKFLFSSVFFSPSPFYFPSSPSSFPKKLGNEIMRLDIYRMRAVSPFLRFRDTTGDGIEYLCVSPSTRLPVRPCIVAHQNGRKYFFISFFLSFFLWFHFYNILYDWNVTFFDTNEHAGLSKTFYPAVHQSRRWI